MTALSADHGRPLREGNVLTLPVLAASTIYKGSAVEVDGDGHASAAVKGANKTYMGVSLGHADNSAGVDEAISVDVQRRGTFLFAYDGTEPDVGDEVYLADDNTVTTVAAGATKFGRVVQVADDGVWVEFN